MCGMLLNPRPKYTQTKPSNSFLSPHTTRPLHIPPRLVVTFSFMSQLAEYLRHFFSLSGSQPDDSQGAETPETQAVKGLDAVPSLDTSPSPRLTDIKYVDYVYDEESHEWTYVDTESNTLAEAVAPSGPAVGSGDWQDYCFVIVRSFPAQMTPGEVIVFKIVIKSAHLLQACEHVLGNIPDVSWNSDPLKVRYDAMHVVPRHSVRLIQCNLAQP